MDFPPEMYLPARPEDKNMVGGVYPPQRIKTEDQDSINVLIRSEDRNYGNDFKFTVNLLTSTAHIRKLSLAKIGMPLLPQINEHDKNVIVTHVDGTVSFDLVEGYYSIQSFINMLQQEFENAFKSLDVTNNVVVSYDIEKRSITITDLNSEAFYIHTECNFNRYGRNVVKFNTLPAGSALPITFSYNSVSVGMIYSRFVVLSSSRLTEDQKTYSVVSNQGPSDIISIIDIASAYDSDQFTVNSSFPGTDVIINTLGYSPRINVLNRNKSLKVMDFTLTDEFNFGLDTLNTPTYSFEYPVFFWFVGYV
jgi:hypothetical protein